MGHICPRCSVMWCVKSVHASMLRTGELPHGHSGSTGTRGCTRCRPRSSLSVEQPRHNFSAVQVLSPQPSRVPCPAEIGVLMQWGANGWLRRLHAQPCRIWQVTRQPRHSSRTRAPVSRTQPPACRAARKVRTCRHACMHAQLCACTRQLHSILSYVLCAVLLPSVPICVLPLPVRQHAAAQMQRSKAVDRALDAHAHQ